MRNPGNETTATDDWELETWFSTDERIGDRDDQLISTVPLAVAPPAPGNETSFQLGVQIPDGIEAGDFRVFIRLRHRHEADEIHPFNNIAVTDEAVIRIGLRRPRIEIDGEGTVGVENLRELYPDGSVVNLFARARKGSVFSQWGGDAQGSLNETFITMDADRTVQAIFVSVAHLGIQVRGAGSVIASRPGGIYAVDEIATLHAIPAAGWEFSGWSGDLSTASASETLVMDANKNVRAVFRLPYRNWKAMHFTTAELNDPAVSGGGLDLDQDGLPLWQEYLHAGDPRDSESPGEIVWQSGPGYFSMIFSRLTGPEPGYILAPQQVTTGAGWSQTGYEERILSAKGGVETVEARLPTNRAPAGLLRLLYPRP